MMMAEGAGTLHRNGLVCSNASAGQQRGAIPGSAHQGVSAARVHGKVDATMGVTGRVNGRWTIGSIGSIVTSKCRTPVATTSGSPPSVAASHRLRCRRTVQTLGQQASR
jgi:hypothetical protein